MTPRPEATHQAFEKPASAGSEVRDTSSFLGSDQEQFKFTQDLNKDKMNTDVPSPFTSKSSLLENGTANDTKKNSDAAQLGAQRGDGTVSGASGPALDYNPKTGEFKYRDEGKVPGPKDYVFGKPKEGTNIFRPSNLPVEGMAKNENVYRPTTNGEAFESRDSNPGSMHRSTRSNDAATRAPKTDGVKDLGGTDAQLDEHRRDDGDGPPKPVDQPPGDEPGKPEPNKPQTTEQKLQELKRMLQELGLRLESGDPASRRQNRRREGDERQREAGDRRRDGKKGRRGGRGGGGGRRGGAHPQQNRNAETGGDDQEPRTTDHSESSDKPVKEPGKGDRTNANVLNEIQRTQDRNPASNPKPVGETREGSVDRNPVPNVNQKYDIEHISKTPALPDDGNQKNGIEHIDKMPPAAMPDNGTEKQHIDKMPQLGTPDQLPQNQSLDMTPAGQMESFRPGEDQRSPEERRKENAKRAADILQKGDMGNDYQRQQIEAMYRQTLASEGPEGVAALTKAINDALAASGSDVRIGTETGSDTGEFAYDAGNRSIHIPNAHAQVSTVNINVQRGGMRTDQGRVEVAPAPYDRHPWSRVPNSRGF